MPKPRDARDIDDVVLTQAGYRIEGPGSEPPLAGRWWWTLYRDGWSGIECGPDFDTASQARRDAAQHLLDDADIDWDTLAAAHRL